MIYKAYSSDTQKFLSLPETGMGYQIFNANLSGISKRFIAYNAQLIVDLDSRFFEYKNQIITLVLILTMTL
jgi:hypothetical protein